MWTSPDGQNEYVHIRQRVEAAGLLQRNPWHFVLSFPAMSALLLLGWGVLFFWPNIGVVLLSAIFLTFVYAQFSFFYHDAGHCQIFRRSWKNDTVGFVTAFVLGASFLWWRETHNQHHEHPNHDELDPDLSIPTIALSEKRARAKRGLLKLLTKHQAWLYFPTYALTAIITRFYSAWFFVGARKSPGIVLDMLCVGGGLSVYLGLLFYALPVWHALAFIVLHQTLWGMYLGMVFAPNHKGMPMPPPEAEREFVRSQVIPSRNIRSHLITDILYGGLNFQIEHHLFPTMHRSYYRKVQPIVRNFCTERGIPYHETGFFGSHLEILRHLRRVSAMIE